MRYYRFKHPDKYKKEYSMYNIKNLKLHKCKCGCTKLTYRIWATGHNLKLHPLPDNLGIYNSIRNHVKRTYKTVFIDGKKHTVHRVIMEEYIKRKLNSNEVVHHKDGNTLNNNLDNLQLFKNKSEHFKLHAKQLHQENMFEVY